ncbi:MAG: hypothetical protein WDN44_06355 [Sphingomonas sp.]
MTTAKGRFEGSAAVIERLSGQWPITPVLAGGVWEIGPGGESQVEARATFPGIGAAPRAYRLSFEFDQQDRVTAITEHVEPFLASSPAATMPPVIRRRIDRAMADGIPITMGYIDEQAIPCSRFAAACARSTARPCASGFAMPTAARPRDRRRAVALVPVSRQREPHDVGREGKGRDRQGRGSARCDL